MPRVINILYAGPGMDEDAIKALHLATKVAERFKEKEEVTVNCHMVGSPQQEEEDINEFPAFQIFQYSGEILKRGPFMSRFNQPLIYHGMVDIREFCDAQEESLDDDEEERFWWGRRFTLIPETNMLN